jgi:RNA polymerase sigma factor (sigma-70 family)
VPFPTVTWNFVVGRGHYVNVIVAETRLNLTDEDVVRLSIGEPELFGLLFERYGNVVFRFLAAQMTAEAAEDATSEAFIAAFRTRHQYRSDAPPRAWLLGIATNVARRHWRARRRFEVALERLHQLLSVGERPTEEEPVGGRGQLSEVVRGALETLPHAQREALILRAWAGLSYEEIAVVMGVRVGTVRSRISRARESFASEIGTKGTSG